MNAWHVLAFVVGLFVGGTVGVLVGGILAGSKRDPHV